MADQPQRPRFIKDMELRGVTMPYGEEDEKASLYVHDLSVIGSVIRPESLPDAQLGVPVFGLSLAYGPKDAAEPDWVRVTLDLTLDQAAALAGIMTDALAQILANAVENSLRAFIAANPEWGPDAATPGDE